MKILVFEPNWLGDVIFTTPIFKALKNNFKDCFIGCVLPERCKDVLRYNPFVDEIIEFNERMEDRRLLRKVLFINKLRSLKYDLVILIHRSFTRTLLCYLANIKERVGYAYRKRAILLTKKIPPLDIDSLHKQDYYLGVLEKMGVKVEDKNCEVYLSPSERNWADKLIKDTASSVDYLAAVNPFSNWPPKNWPLQYYNELISKLKNELKNVKVFLTSKEKKEEFSSLIKKNKDFIVDLTGKLSLRKLIALYEKVHLVISGDSGPLHLAAAVNTKYLGLYGPTNPKLSGPRARAKGKIIFKNDFCTTPCYIKSCRKDFLCMKTITPQEVAEAALELLNS